MEIINNIHIIIAAVVLILADLAAIYKAVDVIIKRVKATQQASAEEKAEAKEAIKENLLQIIFGLVADAEKELGGGTGKLKSAKVAAWVYDKIPDDLKPLFSAEEIQDMIDNGLEKAKEYWKKNSKAREYIDSGTLPLLAGEIEMTGPAAGVDVEEFVKAVGDRIGEAIAKAAESPQGGSKAPEDKIPADGQIVAAAAQDGPTEAKTEPSAE